MNNRIINTNAEEGYLLRWRLRRCDVRRDERRSLWEPYGVLLRLDGFLGLRRVDVDVDGAFDLPIKSRCG